MNSSCQSSLFRRIAIGAVCALSLSASQGACAQNSSGAPQSDPIALYLATGINNEQESKIRRRIEEFQKLTFAKGETMVRLMNEMRALSLQPDPDGAAIDAKQQEINLVNNQMAAERNHMLLDLRKVLNPEQRRKFVELMQAPAATPMK